MNLMTLAAAALSALLICSKGSSPITSYASIVDTCRRDLKVSMTLHWPLRYVHGDARVFGDTAWACAQDRRTLTACLAELAAVEILVRYLRWGQLAVYT